MTEPTLEPGDTWEEFLKRSIIEKCSEELALEEASEFEKDSVKGRISELYLHIDCAIRHIAAEERDILW